MWKRWTPQPFKETVFSIELIVMVRHVAKMGSIKTVFDMNVFDLFGWILCSDKSELNMFKYFRQMPYKDGQVKKGKKNCSATIKVQHTHIFFMVLSLSLSLSLSLTHTFSLWFSFSLSHTHFLYGSLSLSHTHILSPSLSPCLSLSHTHTSHTHITHTHQTHILSPSLSLTRT